MQTDLLDRLLVTLAVRLHASSICQVQRGWRLAFDPFDAITIHYVLRGGGSLRVGEGPWVPFGPYCITIVPARQAHVVGEPEEAVGEVQAAESCRLHGDGLVTFQAGDGVPDTLFVCGQISASYDGALGLFDLFKSPIIEAFESDGVLRQSFDLMLAEVARPGLATQALTEVLMKHCLIILLRRQLSEGDGGYSLMTVLREPRLARAVLAILERPSAPYSVESLATLAGMSRAAFADRFAQVFGQAPIAFVQRVRLRIAYRLLTTTDLPVKVIASTIGYSSRSAFSRVFEEAYGLSPSNHRASGGQNEVEAHQVVIAATSEALAK